MVWRSTNHNTTHSAVDKTPGDATLGESGNP